MKAQFQVLVMAASVFLTGFAAHFAMAENAPADSTQPNVVGVPLANAYIPNGFDNKNRVRLMVDGFFPNTCYRIREPQVTNTGSAITVTQTALKYNGPCLMMMVSYSQQVNVGILKASDYTVKDNFTGRVLGELPVKVASGTKVGPDDYFYANVKDAYLNYVDGTKKAFIVTGVLPGSCWSITEKRIYQDGKNVITILPIIEKTGTTSCTEAETPFTTTVDVPDIAAGRYMLQVRSLNGESIMKLVDL
jgi:hypothetical protein